jgi:hypothetical protein
MLNVLNIPYVKLIILLLGWAKEENIQLGCSLIELDYNLINISENFGTYSTIYNYLRSNNSSILSIFSILCFGFINFYYYGQKSICFNETYCNNFVSELLKTFGSSQGYIFLNNTPQIFLQRDLESISNVIYSVASNKIGLTTTATGPASNIGARYKRTIGTIGTSNKQGTQKKLKSNNNNNNNNATKKQQQDTIGGRSKNSTKSNKKNLKKYPNKAYQTRRITKNI